MKLVVASMNRDKLGELLELLDLPGLELISLRDIPGSRAPAEDGETLLDNARIKARAAAELSNLTAIADDTGLEVDALGGRPGVHAARYAGPGATYERNVARLIGEMAGVPATARAARFRTVCVARTPGGREASAEGVLEGRIAGRPRGSGGFGYDAIFELPCGRTLAELTSYEKNRDSHRARAVRNLRAVLLELSTAAERRIP